MSDIAPSSHVQRQQVRRAVVASTVGTAIEWYDFFLYGTMAGLVFPKLFFSTQSPTVGVLDSFATFFVGFIARPIGAALFGHYGDRIGRKAMLIATLLTMGIGTFLIGVLPGYSSQYAYAGIGIWAPILLIILRIAQGIGVGGEWGGSVVLSMEWGPGRRRGFITSWPQFGVPVGLLLSNGMVALFAAVSGDGFTTWGWRVPFLLSIVLVGVGLYIRLGILETPIFTALQHKRQLEQQPLATVCKRNWREIVLSAFLRLPEQAPFYIFTVFIFTFGTTTLHMSRGFLTVAVVVAAAVELVSIPVFGHLSDVVGRKKVYLAGAVATALWAIPYYFLLGLGLPWLVFLVIVVSLIPHDMLYGPQAALIAESFTGRLRYSGASLGYQAASIIAGGPAPLIAAFLFASYGTAYAISGYIILICIVGFIATVLLPDRSKSDIGVEYDEAVPLGPAPRQERPGQPA